MVEEPSTLVAAKQSQPSVSFNFHSSLSGFLSSGTHQHMCRLHLTDPFITHTQFSAQLHIHVRVLDLQLRLDACTRYKNTRGPEPDPTTAKLSADSHSFSSGLPSLILNSCAQHIHICTYYRRGCLLRYIIPSQHDLG